MTTVRSHVEVDDQSERIHPGARQYALGMALLIEPDSMHKIFAPELFVGTSNDLERATAVATESARLAVGGLFGILLSTARELGIKSVADIRSANLRPAVISSTQTKFDKLYDALEANEAGELNQVPRAFTALRLNPLEDSAVFYGVSHHKHQMLVGDLAGSFPLPYWLSQSGISSVKLGDLNLGFRKHTRS